MHRIKLNPTQWQKEVLRKFNGHCRFTYNACVAARREDPQNNKLNFMNLRDTFVTHSKTVRDNDVDRKSRKPKLENGKKQVHVNQFVEERPWLLYTPVSVRAGAIKQYVAAEKAARTNKKNGNIDRFRMTFRSRRKDHSWSIHVDKRQVRFQDNKLVILKESLCSTKPEYKPSEQERLASFRRPKRQPGKQMPSEDSVRYFEKPPFVGHPPSDCQIHYSRGAYYLQVPVEVTIRPRLPQKAAQPVVGVDPGVRDFMTTFDSTGVTTFVGRREVDKLMTVQHRLSTIQSQLAKQNVDKATRKRLVFQRKKATQQYYNIKNDFHHQAANWIAATHSTIFLEPWQIDHMKRTLRPKAVRRLMVSGAGLFMERLKEKCRRHGTWLPKVDEYLTTKTCCRCGKLHWSIGSDKVFECPHCPNVMDRDRNSAVNMLLKHLNFCEIPPADAAGFGQQSDACAV